MKFVVASLIASLMSMLVGASYVPLVSTAYHPAALNLVQSEPHSWNTAVVHSDRIGGSFAYSISEGPTYPAYRQLISTSVHQPVLSYQWAGAGLPIIPGSLAPQWFLQQPPLIASFPSPLIPGIAQPPAPPSVDAADVESVSDEADQTEAQEATTEEATNDGVEVNQSDAADDDDSVSVDSA